MEKIIVKFELSKFRFDKLKKKKRIYWHMECNIIIIINWKLDLIIILNVFECVKQ